MEKIQLREKANISSIPEVAEIQFMIKLELVMSELYLTLKKCTREYPRFWDRISKEEIAHSKILENLSLRFKEGDVSVCKIRFPIATIEESRLFICKRIDSIRDKSLDIVEALDIAEKAETLTLDAVTFKIFEGVSKEARNIIKKLEKYTDEHLRRVKKMQRYVKLPLVLRIFLPHP